MSGKGSGELEPVTPVLFGMGEIAWLVEALPQVEGVTAIVLGGSRARGTAHPASDVDLGIYYDPRQGLNTGALDRVAASLDDRRRTGLVTAVGEWGPWINGGGWLMVNGVPVDLLYRDLSQVARVIKLACKGQFEMVRQPGHPFGFLSTTYASEVAICRELYDPGHCLAELKGRLASYPDRLRQALVTHFLWEASFSIEVARKAVARADVAYVAAQAFYAVTAAAQVLFALNRTHWLNEKGAVAVAGRFPKVPAGFETRVSTILGGLRADAVALAAALDALLQLAAEVRNLAEAEGLV